jgi:hypothetical protein
MALRAGLSRGQGSRPQRLRHRGCGRKGRSVGWRGAHGRNAAFLQICGALHRSLLAPRLPKLEVRTLGRLAKVSDQERRLNEVLDILGPPRDTAYRDYARELVERGASLEQIYGTLQSRMNSTRS